MYTTELEHDEQKLYEAWKPYNETKAVEIRDMLIAKYSPFQYGLMMKRVIARIEAEKNKY